jgi:hypothetical protein
MIRVVMLKQDRGSPDGVQVSNFQAGAVYNLPDDLAERFIRDKTARKALPDEVGGEEESTADAPSEAPSEAPEAGGEEAKAPETPEGGDGSWDERQSAIAAAIRQLDPAEDFTESNKPSVNRIKDIMNDNVSAEERDVVWAKLQE